jgi:hypothetical protein
MAGTTTTIKTAADTEEDEVTTAVTGAGLEFQLYYRCTINVS